MAFPIKLNDAYTCQGVDANGQSVTFNDLLTEGERIGHLSYDGTNTFPPHGRVVKRDDGLWIEAEDAI